MIELTLIAGLVGFYMINLALGFYQGRNIRTVSTYVFGHRYSTGVLLLTLTGTFVGADYLTYWFRAGSTHGGGSALLWFLCTVLTGLLAAYYIFPKLRSFKHWYTLGDIVRQAYGSKHAQLAVDGISTVSSVLLLSAQLVALQRIAALLGIGKDSTYTPYILVASFALVVIAYASRAGTPGVVSTDVLQMVLILGGTVFISYKILNLKLDKTHISGLRDLWSQLGKISHRNTLTYFFKQSTSFKRSVLSSIGGGLLLFSPAFIKRVGMASDNRQLKHSMLGFMTVFSFFVFMILTISYGLFVVHGGRVSNSNVYPTLLKAISSQLWMKLLLLSMFMAAVMSTADSTLTAASLCAVRMITLLQAKGQDLPEPDVRKLRLANVGIGLIALFLALIFLSQPVAIFVIFARSILAGLLPCLVGISLGIKKSSKALLRSMICFALFSVGSMILPRVADLSFIYYRITHLALMRIYRTLLPFVILLSIVAYLVFEAIVHKGLKWEPRERFTKEKPSLIALLKKQGASLWKNPVAWAEEKLSDYESRGVLLMLLCIAMSLTSMLSTLPFHDAYLTPMTVLMLVVFALCTFNLFPEQWYAKLRVYYPLFWMVSLCICVPCASLLRWLYHPTLFNALYLVFVPMIMYGMIGRRLGMGLSLMGYLLGLGVYQLTADASLSFSATHSLIPLGCLLFSTLLTWLLLGYHTQRRLAKAGRPKMWAASWGHDFNHLFMEAQFETMIEYNPLPEGKDAQHEEMKNRLAKVAKHLKNAINQSRAFSQLMARDSIRASEIENLPLTVLMEYVYTTLTKEFQAMTRITGKAPMKVKVFKPIFANVVSNLLRNAWKVGATKIELTWDEKAPILYVKDNGPGVPKEKMATLFEWKNQRDGTGIGLPFIKEALAKMGALIDLQSSDQGAVFMILFEQEDTPQKV